MLLRPSISNSLAQCLPKRDAREVQSAAASAVGLSPRRGAEQSGVLPDAGKNTVVNRRIPRVHSDLFLSNRAIGARMRVPDCVIAKPACGQCSPPGRRCRGTGFLDQYMIEIESGRVAVHRLCGQPGTAGMMHEVADSGILLPQVAVGEYSIALVARVAVVGPAARLVELLINDVVQGLHLFTLDGLFDIGNAVALKAADFVFAKNPRGHHLTPIREVDFPAEYWLIYEYNFIKIGGISLLILASAVENGL